MPAARLVLLICTTFVRLPVAFLAGSCATLVCMDLEDVDISANEGAFDLSMLSFLRLNSERVGEGGQFIALLRGSPRLETLLVSTGLAVTSPMHSKALPKVTLQCLRTLDISCISAALPALLAIILAPSTNLSIDATAAHAVFKLDHSTFQYVIDFWSRVTGGDSLPDGHLMHIDLRPGNRCELRFGQQFSCDDVPREVGPRMSSKYPYEHHGGQPAIHASILELADTVRFLDQCKHPHRADVGPHPRHLVIK